MHRRWSDWDYRALSLPFSSLADLSSPRLFHLDL
jgi:hypothetical protein